MKRRSAFIILAAASCLFAADAVSVAKISWGITRVRVTESWPGATAGRDWKRLSPGIGLLRSESSSGTGLLDYEQKWTVEPEHAAGVVVLLATEVPPESRVEVTSFGRSGGAIELTAVLRSKGGVIPEWLHAVVRRKLGMAENSVTPVSMENIQAAKIGGKRVVLAGGFPEDLPKGEYSIKVELLDEGGKTLETFASRVVRGEKDETLQKLSDEELLAEYVKRAEVLKGTAIQPTDNPMPMLAAAFPYESPPSKAWQATHAEIVRRGKPMVERLMKLLEGEAVRNPEKATAFGLAIDLMRILVQIDDPRAVPLLLRIADGMDGKANVSIRGTAVRNLGAITRVIFQIDKDNPSPSQAMIDESAEVISRPPLLPEAKEIGPLAEKYAKWLEGPGKDPAQWMPLAKQRARKALEGHDPLAIRNAVAFLGGGYYYKGHDNESEEALRAVAGILQHGDKAVLEANRFSMDLPSAVANYGPAARPYVDDLLAGAGSPPSFVTFAQLEQVGGEKAVAYMVGVLPALRKRLADFHLSPEADLHQGFSNLDASRELTAYRGCIWAIERWTGRTFAGDAEIAAWWQANKDKSQRQWLEKNLERTAAEADGGNARAQLLLRQAIPALPHAEEDDPIDRPWQIRERGSYRENRLPPFRAAWLKEQRGKIQYDEKLALFVLVK
jgi:hypothetical protein